MGLVESRQEPRRGQCHVHGYDEPEARSTRAPCPGTPYSRSPVRTYPVTRTSVPHRQVQTGPPATGGLHLPAWLRSMTSASP